MKKQLGFILMLLLVVAGLAACGSNNEDENQEGQADGETRVIQHEMGETEITGKPQRIVVLEFSYVDALAALGISPVGIADDKDDERIITPIREKIDDYTSVGTRKQPSEELIASLNPDLIIADLKRHKDIYDSLSEEAPTIVLSSLASDYEGILEGFEVIAEAVGEEEKGQEVLAAHKEKMEELRSQVPEDETRTVLPAVVTNTGFYAHNMDSYTGSLLESIGLKNAIQSGDDRYNQINLEQVVQFNPDIIFTMNAGEQTIINDWEDKTLWKEVSAVKNDAIYEVDRNTWSRFRGLISSETILEDAIQALYGE
ncbi:ABC transporter substrate-binding protein [Salirhabdus salicampi]|uniref:ABC transporter substrate-binding protein n=1 Tax=Salirhabdus salicampi TaxID=476102 RepID=UPI0020C5859D|nr:Fe(3+) dicitrate ABC transporter substrate-binding protein [Salirhabdus salicampi]MCP8615304.1 Fe(3+) dicitrate ABC transporter substrate-binding protein [Salirhabdus salicampi]